MHKLMNNLDLSRVRYLFVTHFHMDHFYPQELTVRGSVYSLEMISPELEIYCAQETYDYSAAVPIGKLTKKATAPCTGTS